MKTRNLIPLVVFIALAGNVAKAQNMADTAMMDTSSSSGGPGLQYIIGPGDTLEVFVWQNPELSVEVPVRPDGRITTPLVEEMPAAGKTAHQLARDIEGILSNFIRSPQVSVIVSTPQSLMNEVKVVGQVNNPQGVPYREGMTVLDLVLEVGGLADFAAGNRARIVRTEHGERREIKVKLNSLINRGDLGEDHELRPGDVLVVPESRF